MRRWPLTNLAIDGTELPAHDCSFKAGAAACPHCPTAFPATRLCEWCMAIHLREAHADIIATARK